MPVSLKTTQIAGALQRLATASGGNRELQATTAGGKRYANRFKDDSG